MEHLEIEIGQTIGKVEAIQILRKEGTIQILDHKINREIHFMIGKDLPPNIIEEIPLEVEEGNGTTVLTLFPVGSGITLTRGRGPLWPG